MMFNYNKSKDTYQRKKKRQNEALELEKFIMKAGPVMEKVIDENAQNFFVMNRGAAAKRNAVELKQNVKFPQELLWLFTDQNNQPAQLEKITCVHMFESAP